MRDPHAHTLMTRARTALVLRHPFFASLALRLPMREDYTCQTAWTDGAVLAYNPHYVSILSPEKLEGLTAHLVMHPACGHHRRRQGRDLKTWNRACDYVINGILLDAGLTLPDGYLHQDRYRGECAESVYEILRGDGSQQSEETTNREQADSDRREKQESPDDGRQDDDGRKKRDENREDRQSSPDAGSGLAGEVRDAPGAPGREEKSEIDWEEALILAAVNAREAGRLPAGIERLVKELAAPRLSWRELLFRFIRRSARSDYSWLRPNRRHLHRDLYLPSFHSQELGEIVVAIDTSGSIEDAELQRFTAEMRAILEQCPATVHLLYCDMNIVRSEVFQRHDPPVMATPAGGGGTDYRPVFDHVARSGISPDCLIYMTDLECDLFPAVAPPYPTLWVQTGAHKAAPFFGELVRLHPHSGPP